MRHLLGALLTEVLDGVGPDVLGDADGDVVGGGEDFRVVLVKVVVVILVVVLVDLLAGLALLTLGLLLLKGLLGLLGRDVAAAEAEPGEEGDAAEAGGLHLGEQRLLGLGVVFELLAGGQLALGGADLADEVEQALGQVLVLGLPVDLDGLRDEAGPAVLGVAPPKLLLERRVGKVLVGAKGELDGDAARVAARGELEALDGEVGERVEQHGRVGGLDVLVEVGGRLLEDEGPEVGDVGNDLGALGVEVGGELGLLADCVCVSLFVSVVFFSRFFSGFRKRTELNLDILKVILELLELAEGDGVFNLVVRHCV